MLENCGKITEIFPIFVILKMKIAFRTILIAFGLTLMLLPSCGRKHQGAVVELNIDSLFIDLGQSRLEQRAAMADKAFREMRDCQGLNGTVLYAEGGQVIYRHAFGWRNLVNRKDSIRIDDQFQLASVSKMFTAEAIMLLHSQGKLSYDDTIAKFIPEFPYGSITIRNLLNHRSGLSRYETLADEQWPDRGVPLHNEDVIALYAQYRPEPYNQPDVTFHYSNVNYALLASVVERISGQHFEDFMHDNIFVPLGMDRSYIYSLRNVDRLKTFVDTDVQGHDILRRGVRRAQEDYLNGVVGDKVMYSTVDDLYKFSLAIDGGGLLPDSIQREAFVPGSPHWKRGENYGFGWRLHANHPGAIYHFGWWKGYRTFFIKDLEKGRTLIVLTNTDSGVVGESLWDFVNDTTVKIPVATPYCVIP